jgi:hypothetical protein
MTRRSLGAGLGALALIGTLGPAPDGAAKPPDLPQNQRIIVVPPDHDAGGPIWTSPPFPRIDRPGSDADNFDYYYQELLKKGAGEGRESGQPGAGESALRAAWGLLPPSEQRALALSLLYSVHPFVALDLTEGGGEEECEGPADPEEGVDPAPKSARMHANLPGVREQVDGLMKACRLAMADGRPAKAADLARQAHALDPERVKADPLAYKLCLLEWKEEPCPAGPKSPKCPACPQPGQNVEKVTLCPHLPPIDPGVVQAREVLEDKGVFGRPCGEATPGGSGDTPCRKGCCPCRRVARFMTWVCQSCNTEVDVDWRGLWVSCAIPVGGTVVNVRYSGGLFSFWMTETAH